MSLNINIPKINEYFNEDNIRINLEKYFSEIANEWWKHQVSWNNEAYSIFRDHDKFLISIYLIKKTLDYYARNFQKYSMNEFFSQEKIEIDKFNVIEISNFFLIPKETVRRKLIELEKNGSIVKSNRKIVLILSTLPFYKPTDSTKKIAYLLSKFSKILKKNKFMHRVIESDEISQHIIKNFIYCFQLYYKLQLEISMNWKSFFKDFETYHIWGLCVTNKSYNYPQKKRKYMAEYSNFIIGGSNECGLNAMTISDMSGIPRATVVRKLKKLIKKKHLILDKKKRYHPTGFHMKEMLVLQKNNIKKLAEFTTKIFNQVEN